MRVKIREIVAPGDAQKERLVLEVVQDDDIGRYAVFLTHILEAGNVSATVRRTYWFPDKKVRSKDLVVLYTKVGTPSEQKNKDESTSHFFYWGADSPLWRESNATAVLAHIDEWQHARRDVARSASATGS